MVVSTQGLDLTSWTGQIYSRPDLVVARIDGLAQQSSAGCALGCGDAPAANRVERTDFVRSGDARREAPIAVAKPLVEFLDEIDKHPVLTVLPLTSSIASESGRLGEDFHRGPADQIIVATARCHGLTLITADERIRKWGKVNLL